MTNGKRMTNQFTDEQIEAGAKAYWLASEREIHDKPITWEWDKEERRRYMWAARQVLAGVILAALDGAPEPEAGTKVVIGKQNRGDDDESWTFTEWEPFELEKAREEFPNSVYEVVTVFGLPVEGEKP